MIRTVQYQVTGTGNWQEGILHGFSNDNAIIEDKASGAIFLHNLHTLAFGPTNLKFSINADDWMKLQAEAQQAAATRHPLVPR